MNKKIRNLMSRVMCFIILTVNTFSIGGGKTPKNEIPVNFELEVTGSVAIEQVFLDFGNIIKNSGDLKIAKSHFKVKITQEEEVLVSMNYSEGIVEGDYTKVDIFKQGGNGDDKVEVYLRNIKNKVLAPNKEYEIPLFGEIRSVGNISLGKYEKTLRLDVVLIPSSTF